MKLWYEELSGTGVLFTDARYGLKEARKEEEGRAL